MSKARNTQSWAVNSFDNLIDVCINWIHDIKYMSLQVLIFPHENDYHEHFAQWHVCELVPVISQAQYKRCQHKEELLSLSFILNLFANDKAFKRTIFLIRFLLQPYFSSFVNHICFSLLRKLCSDSLVWGKKKLWDVTSQVLMFHMHNMEGMLLQISESACASSSMFSSGRTQVSHRMITVSLGITIHLNLRSSFFSRAPRRSAAQPLPSPRCGCALVAAVHQGWCISTARQDISDLVCSYVFIASKFLPLNSTIWDFPKEEIWGICVEVNGDGWPWLIS